MEEGCESSVKDNIEDEKVATDTPERGSNNQIATTVCKFEVWFGFLGEKFEFLLSLVGFFGLCIFWVFD